MRFLTGLQPSGKLHIGNYFGAIQAAIDLQNKGEAFYFIANYHAMTTSPDAETLRANTYEMAIDLLACGLDPEKAVFFAQSSVPEVNELAWILSTVCPMGLLERCHSYKDKIAKGFSPNHALFAYPALMAADILLYDSDAVPVGKDQKQHLEVTRDLAGKINDAYGEGLLRMPEAIISEVTAIVPGLDGQKMSKSRGNAIMLSATEDETAKLIKKAKTDGERFITYDPVNRPEVANLLMLISLCTDEEPEAIAARIGDGGGGMLKNMLTESLNEKLRPLREERKRLEQSPDYIRQVLLTGAEKARNMAIETLNEVRHVMNMEI